MNLILFGPPGAGKGTQSQLLIEKRQLKHISTGDLFRSAIKNQTPLGKEAKGYLDRGQLVPDSVTIGLVSEVLDGLKGQNFVLDGFPRNIPQAEALEKMLGEKKLKVDRAIFLKVPDETVVDRLAGRRTCAQCGTVYHTTNMRPAVEGVCDNCEGELKQRPDDQEQAIRERLKIYHTNTNPLEQYYDRLGKAAVIQGEGEVFDVYKRIESKL